jgi:hypothetical protein|tara:strand:+ start:748 stop:978 length:231 start_codon:yes stop_codon:yes gene_type:complete
MGNKTNLKWVLILFDGKDKKNIVKVWSLDTIKDIGYILDMNPRDISNYYHKLIRSRGNLDYCEIYQTYQDWKTLNI